MRPWLKQLVLRPPDQVFPQLSRALPAQVTIFDSSPNIRSFLDECDRVLIDRIGERGLAELLRDSDISPEQFLEAQKPGFMERVFRA